MANPKVNPEIIGKVIVERIMDAKAGNNPDYKAIMVRQILKRAGQDSITSMFLGGDFTEQRVAVQSIHNDQLEAFGIKVGDDLSTKMDVGLKVKITEITQSEFDALEANDQRGFSEKENPQNGQKLATADGETIYRKTEVAAAADADKKVAHVKTANVAVAAEVVAEAIEVTI
jgi:nicotinic acid phosphoribosyltransferase